VEGDAGFDGEQLIAVEANVFALFVAAASMRQDYF